MMLRTHIAFGVLAILLFLPHVQNKVLFILVTLFASVIPDIDTGFSSVGNYKPSKVVQFFTKHRGFIHSFTLCIIISIALVLLLPVFALPFFLGYAMHLFTDSFTKDGIRPFWPLKNSSAGHLRTGGRIETSIFIFLILIDIFLAIYVFRAIS